MDRASWKVESREAVSLAMLRELYVAVTRAKRRVVILVQSRSDTMLRFLAQLNCDLQYHQNTTSLFREFNTTTSTNQWLMRANELFREERYDIASRCYEKAELPSMVAWALGRHFAQQKDKKRAKQYFLQASQEFHELNECEKVLDLGVEVLTVSDWNEKPPQFIKDSVFLESLNQCPHHLGRRDRLRIEIFRDKWEGVHLDDIQDNPTLVSKRRNYPGLMKFMCALDRSDLWKLSQRLPCVVADVCFYRKQYHDATNLFLAGKDFEKATDSSEAMIQVLDGRGNPESLLKLMDLWKLHMQYVLAHTGSKMFLLFNLFDDPENASRKKPLRYVQALNPSAVKFAVAWKNLNPTILHSFCKKSFHDDVKAELQRQHKDDLAKVVIWLLFNGDKDHATEFVSERLSTWKTDELFDFTKKGIQSVDMAQEYFDRRLYYEAARMFVAFQEEEKAIRASNKALDLNVEAYAFKIVQLSKQAAKRKNWTSGGKLGLVITLFNNPFWTSENKNISKECMTNLGPNVIQEAVLRSFPYFLKEGEENKYVDIQEILLRFGRNANMPRRKILEYLQQHYGCMQGVDEFIKFHMEKWTHKDLFDIAKWGFRTEGLADEFFKRHHHTKAAELFLEARNFDSAVEASNCALASPALASKNAKTIKKLWLTHRFESKFIEERFAKTNLHLLLLLYQNPHNASTQYANDCYQRFGPDIVREAVLGCAPYTSSNSDSRQQVEDELSVLARFHMEAFRLDGLRVIEHYKKQSDATNAARFATSHMQQWSNDDLLNIMDLGVQLVGLPDELYRRGLFHLAALEHAKAGNFELAAGASEQDLQQSLVSLDKSHSTLELWQPHVNKHETIPVYIETKPRLWLLIFLFRDPIAASVNYPGNCMKYFEPSVIRKAVLACYPYSNSNDIEIDPKNVLERFDNKKGAFAEIDKIDILRALNAGSRDTKSNAERYANANVDFWSHNIRDLNGQDIFLLLELGSRPTGIAKELLRRKMYWKAVELFLEVDSKLEAVSASNGGLATVKLADANAESIVKAWEKVSATDKNNLQLIPQTCKLWLLLHLFQDPLHASKAFGRQCVSGFGPRVVKAAVLHNPPYEKETGDVLRAFDSKVFATFGKKGRGKTAGKVTAPSRAKGKK